MNEASKRTGPDSSCEMIILADVSSSMVGQSIARLKRDLISFWPEVNARLLAFSHEVTWCAGPDDLPEVGGSTNLALALATAATCWPSEVLVMSDGEPDDQQKALDAATLIPGTISVLFVGSDDNREGLKFLEKLALIGGGMFAKKDLSKNLSIAGELRSMLGLPAPISMGSPEP